MKFLKPYTTYLNESTTLSPTQTGLDLVKQLKKEEANVAEWHHLPCYAFTYKYMSKFKKISPEVMNVMKMPYNKDITSLSAKESIDLGKRSLEIPLPADLAKMSGFKYINEHYGIGKLVDANSAKIGDAINFWVYEFIEFSPAQKNYSFPDTEQNFKAYVAAQTKNNPQFKINPNDWFIESVKLIYGHYAIVSEIDSNYLYLSSSGEKNGANGIWNGVSKSETSDMFTKIKKSDILKFNNMKYSDFLYKRSDDLSEKRSKLVLRASILNFI